MDFIEYILHYLLPASISGILVPVVYTLIKNDNHLIRNPFNRMFIFDIDNYLYISISDKIWYYKNNNNYDSCYNNDKKFYLIGKSSLYSKSIDKIYNKYYTNNNNIYYDYIKLLILSSDVVYYSNIKNCDDENLKEKRIRFIDKMKLFHICKKVFVQKVDINLLNELLGDDKIES